MLGLTAADYLAWSWSAAYGPQVVALVCGLVLTLLLLALAWVLLVSAVRLLARRRPAGSRVVVRHGRSLGARARSSATKAAGPRRAASGVARLRIRRGGAHARRLPEHAGRQPVESARASRHERIAA